MMENRYKRQTVLKDFGPEKQDLLKRGRALVVGAGGLGIPVLQYLTAMGVGTLGIAEQDEVELSNLQRQVFYGEGDVGKPKLQVACEKLRGLNSDTLVKGHDTFLTKANALEIISGYDLVVDASDNFATRYLINDACVILNKPFVSGAIHGLEGQLSVFNFEGGPTYRCLFPSPPKQEEIGDCNANGVLGVIPGIIGTLQAMEAVKVLTRMPGVLKGVLLLYDGIGQNIRHIRFPVVAENKTRTVLEPEYEQPFCQPVLTVEVDQLKAELRKDPGKICLIDVRTREEFLLDGLPDALNIPLEALGSSLGSIPGEKPLYFVCRSGTRSRDAIRILNDHFQNTPMYSINGGMEAWNRCYGEVGKIR